MCFSMTSYGGSQKSKATVIGASTVFDFVSKNFEKNNIVALAY